MGSFARRFGRHRFRRGRTAILLVVSAVVLVTAIVLLMSGSRDGARQRQVDAVKHAAATVDAFDHAVLARDFATICDHLFTPEARSATGGAGCVSTLSASGQGFRRLKVTALSLQGDVATATVLAEQDGRPPAAERLVLVRRGQRYLISSAIGPPET